LILLILSEKRIAFREVSDIDQTGRFLARGSALEKIRNPKLEIRNKSQIRMFKCPNRPEQDADSSA